MNEQDMSIKCEQIEGAKFKCQFEFDLNEVEEAIKLVKTLYGLESDDKDNDRDKDE